MGISSGGSVGSQFLGNVASGLLVGANGSGSASSTTKSAVSEGTIVIRDKDKQQQDVANLSRDAEHANQTLSPIFDKEKEQNRLREAQLIGEIGVQAGNIARTQGDLEGIKKAKADNPGLPAPGENASRKERDAYMAALRETDSYKETMKQYGTGSSLQQGIQAATAAIQGLAGGNMAQAITGAANPYIAEQIHKLTEGNPAAQAMAHAVVGAVVSHAAGNSALAGAAGAASGELMAQLVMKELYPGKKVSELTETEKQTISALGTLAAGLAGGISGDSLADAVAGAQTGKNAVENNYLSVSEKTELELAKQILQKSKDPKEREIAQLKYDALREKDVTSDQKVIDACGNGAAGSAACASARLEVIVVKGEYESIGNYNSKASQQYADAYGQIVNLLNITSVDAQNQQQIQDAMINYFMVTKRVDYATAKDYTELKKGAEDFLASVTPILGAAAGKQLSKIVDANLKVVAKGNVDGVRFSDTNQGARPSQLADFNKPTLINDVVQAKLAKDPSKNPPNGNMGTAHAEVGVIQQAYDKGMTNGKDMLMSVKGEPVCSYCLSDVKAMAAKSGLKSLTIFEEDTGRTLYWEAGTKKFRIKGAKDE